MTRVFLGLGLSARVAAELGAAARSVLAPSSRDLRLCADADLHLTLCFLGEVDAATIAHVGAALSRADVFAPRLVIDHTGAFPTRGKPRVLWAGVSGAPDTRAVELERLATLAQSAEHWARDAGVAVESEGPFVPHITLARARERTLRDLDAFFALPLALAWRPDAITLFASESRPGATTRYPVLARATLRRAE